MRFQTLLCTELRRAFARGKLERLPAEVAADATSFDLLLARACRKRWVVYSKAPFGGPREVLAYLAAYTHRTAISNRRILAFDGETVTFLWRDYADENQVKPMTLPVEEFIRRFLLHVLPNRFVRIRYIGFLGNHNRARSLAMARALLAAPEPPPTEDPPEEPRLCRVCGKGSLQILARLEPIPFTWERPPPVAPTVPA